MRLFVAVNLSDEQRKIIKIVQKQLRLAADGKGRYTAAENYHITLAYIGEHDLKPVISALSRCSFSAFDLYTGGLGNFGSTCFAGVSSNGSLEKLAAGVRSVLQTEGIPFDGKNFVPHITLARDVPKQTHISAIALPHGERMRVDSFCLFRSELLQGKRVYTPLFTVYARSHEDDGEFF